MGDWVYLKLQPYKQTTVFNRPNQKLAVKYFGPYLITKRLGHVAYTLQLPPASRIHPTFHVSLLKRHHGPAPTTMDDSLTNKYDSASEAPPKLPAVVQEVRTMKKQNAAQVQWLVRWSQSPPEEDTREDARKILQEFPHFDPWGQGSSEQGSIDVWLGMDNE